MRTNTANEWERLTIGICSTLGSLIRPDEQVSLVDAECQETTLRKQQSFSDNISYAFQLAMAQGPLCQEPMQGIAVFVQDVSFPQTQDEQDNIAGQSGRLTGEMIRTVRDSILKGFLDWSPRLLLAMYSCEIQASSKIYYTCLSVSQMYFTDSDVSHA